ncbi:unnamed protein product [Vitrella brassicaformis CCMP3155]|uniref:WW domain-containing protein n=2 Tax=Vitrella brassicaformis TaxID=1169539 RepID=A0A0G4EWL7_VITBC|nr:unnamed protein product [Vitrella brassicaformis CCMP3155]|eukprot:CEM02653.1 unnamed protein product [Vitrella brassicaformis CCMP3155]
MASLPNGANANANDIIELEEEIDEDYEPSQEEILEYAEWLGMDKEEDKDLLWIAKEALKAPLPAEWKPCQTSKGGEIFYFNYRTHESQWDHPCDAYYRKLLQDYKAKRAKAKGEPDRGDAATRKSKDRDKGDRKKKSKKARQQGGKETPKDADSSASGASSGRGGGKPPLPDLRLPVQSKQGTLFGKPDDWLLKSSPREEEETPADKSAASSKRGNAEDERLAREVLNDIFQLGRGRAEGGKGAASKGYRRGKPEETDSWSSYESDESDEPLPPDEDPARKAMASVPVLPTAKTQHPDATKTQGDIAGELKTPRGVPQMSPRPREKENGPGVDKGLPPKTPRETSNEASVRGSSVDPEGDYGVYRVAEGMSEDPIQKAIAHLFAYERRKSADRGQGVGEPTASHDQGMRRAELPRRDSEPLDVIKEEPEKEEAEETEDESERPPTSTAEPPAMFQQAVSIDEQRPDVPPESAGKPVDIAPTVGAPVPVEHHDEPLVSPRHVLQPSVSRPALAPFRPDLSPSGSIPLPVPDATAKPVGGLDVPPPQPSAQSTMAPSISRPSTGMTIAMDGTAPPAAQPPVQLSARREDHVHDKGDEGKGYVSRDEDEPTRTTQRAWEAPGASSTDASETFLQTTTSSTHTGRASPDTDAPPRVPSFPLHPSVSPTIPPYPLHPGFQTPRAPEAGTYGQGTTDTAELVRLVQQLLGGMAGGTLGGGGVGWQREVQWSMQQMREEIVPAVRRLSDKIDVNMRLQEEVHELRQLVRTLRLELDEYKAETHLTRMKEKLASVEPARHPPPPPPPAPVPASASMPAPAAGQDSGQLTSDVFPTYRLVPELPAAETSSSPQYIFSRSPASPSPRLAAVLETSSTQPPPPMPTMTRSEGDRLLVVPPLHVSGLSSERSTGRPPLLLGSARAAPVSQASAYSYSASHVSPRERWALPTYWATRRDRGYTHTIGKTTLTRRSPAAGYSRPSHQLLKPAGYLTERRTTEETLEQAAAAAVSVSTSARRDTDECLMTAASKLERRKMELRHERDALMADRWRWERDMESCMGRMKASMSESSRRDAKVEYDLLGEVRGVLERRTEQLNEAMRDARRGEEKLREWRDRLGQHTSSSVAAAV